MSEETQDTFEFEGMRTDAMIAALAQGKGIIYRFPVTAEYLRNLAAQPKPSAGFEAPDSLIFEAEIPLSEVPSTCVQSREGLDAPDAEKVEGTAISLTETRTLRGMCWAEPSSLVFVMGDQSIRIGYANDPQADAEWSRVCEALNARNVRRGFTPPFEMGGGQAKDTEPTAPPTPRKRLPPQAKALPPAPLFLNDNVHGAAVRALARAGTWPPKPIEGFAYGIHQEFRNLKITVGLPDGTQAESLWAFLAKGGPRMVKAHYALWGRWYEDGDGDGKSRDYITINVTQFCADLGYTRHHKGGYRLREKQEAVRILEALTSVELRATWTKPGAKQGPARTVRLRGPLWSRGLLSEEDRYTDLFGQAREGDPSQWEPLAFSYAPGQWFEVKEWRSHNNFVGKIGAGLMQLDNRYDEWAVLIGGYLGTLLRIGQYAPRRLRVGTILHETGLAQGEDAKRRATQYQDKFERALDRLVEVGVIASWSWPDVDAAELSDPDDPQAVAAYYAEEPFPKGDWRARCVEIRPPECRQADHERLLQAQTKAVEAKRGRKQQREAA